MNTWNRYIHTGTQNVHNVHNAPIYNIGIPKHKKNPTYDFLVQVRNFLLPLSLKVFQHKERDTIFLCWLFHLPQATCDTCPRPRRASESQPSSSDGKTQLTDFSQISAHASGHDVIHIPGHILYLGFFLWHLWMTPPLRACVNTYAHICT